MTVSVIMITYNHEQFIEEAIVNVLNQQTDFEFELIIANDCSTDQTDAIINKIIATHPAGKKINYILQKSNQGANRNFVSAFNLSSAKYIAMCEGDDYWTDVNKLQKQVEFLENNSKYAGVAHPVTVLDEINHTACVIENNLKDIDRKTILNKNGISTLSLVFRNKIILPHWLSDVKIGDFVLHLLNLKNGMLYYMLDDNMGVYRVHTEGNYESQTQAKKYGHQLSMLQYMIKDSSFEFDFVEKVMIKHQLCQIHLHNASGTIQNRHLHDFKYKLLGKFYSFIIKACGKAG